ncbi:MAG: AarF/UbiB family protein [Myxococcota bacterium]
MAKRPPRGKLGRLARLGGLTSRVSGSYLGQRIRSVFQDDEDADASLRRVHLENAERIVDTMGLLKGAAMKVGQSLAQVVDGMDLPPEMANILGKLNNKATPIPFSLIKASIERELDARIDDLFSDFDEEPLGTASLAQAHAARLPSGEAVVVKVLHDGIEDSVDSDLSALKTLFLTGRVLRRDRSEIDAIFAELRDRLSEELDYYQEAANLEHFHRSLADFPDIHVPSTHPQYCTERVLTMDRLLGRSLDDFLPMADRQAKQKAGDLLALAFHDMFYRQRALHADPHPGNYLFRTDGGLGILDFGCVKRFDVYFVANYARMAKTLVLGERDAFMDAAQQVGILTDGPAESRDVLWSFGELIGHPLRQEQYACSTGVDEMTTGIQRMMPQILRYPNIRSPRTIIYLHRSLSGIYSMIRRLEHEGRYRELFLRHVDHAIAVAEGRREDGSVVR